MTGPAHSPWKPRVLEPPEAAKVLPDLPPGHYVEVAPRSYMGPYTRDRAVQAVYDLLRARRGLPRRPARPT